MSDERWVVLGLAHPRAAWFRELARWATAAALPIDFVKCVSCAEARTRFAGGRSYSALLVGGDVVGLDRDLVDTASAAGAAVIVVDPGRGTDWADVGAAACLTSPFDRDQLLATLEAHAVPVARVAAATPGEEGPEGGWRGRLIAVTGPGGTGTSVVAMAIAQAFAAEPSNAAMVLLADLSLHADLGVLHDTREVVPSVQELAEAHRSGRLPIDRVRSTTFDALDRGYHLLLGLRRHRDWTAIRPRAFAAALDGLMRSYRLVIADVDADLEGERLTGSTDVEDRNVMARTVLPAADLVVVVGNPTVKGLHALARTVREFAAEGIEPSRIVPVLNRAARNPRRRAEAVAALVALLGRDLATAIGNPVVLGDRGDVEDAIRDGVRLPWPLSRPIHAALTTRMEARPSRHHGRTPPALAPAPVVAGSVGSWTEEAG